MAKHAATRHKRVTAATTRRKKKRAVTWTANTGSVFHAANTEPTNRNWYSWKSAATGLSENHFRRTVPRGSSRAITARWINKPSFVRGSISRNYPNRAWTRSMTRYPRFAAREASLRGKMLAGHLSAIEEGRENGLGATVQLNGPEEGEFWSLQNERDDGGMSAEKEARYLQLLAKRTGQ